MYVTVGLRNVVYFFANLKFATRLQRGSSNLRRTAHDRTNQQLNQFLLIRHPQQQSIRAHENGACTYVYVCGHIDRVEKPSCLFVVRAQFKKYITLVLIWKLHITYHKQASNSRTTCGRTVVPPLSLQWTKRVTHQVKLAAGAASVHPLDVLRFSPVTLTDRVYSSPA